MARIDKDRPRFAADLSNMRMTETVNPDPAEIIPKRNDSVGIKGPAPELTDRKTGFRAEVLKQPALTMLCVDPETVEIKIDKRREPVPQQKITVAADSINRSDLSELFQQTGNTYISAMKDHIRTVPAEPFKKYGGKTGTVSENMRVGKKKDPERIFIRCNTDFHKNIIIRKGEWYPSEV